MGELNSDDHYIYYCEQECLRRNGVALIINKRVQNAVLGCNLKNERMISLHFQGKPFNIAVMEVYAPNISAEEAEVEWFFEDLQDLLELTPKKKKRCPFHHRGLDKKLGNQETPGVTGKFGLGEQDEAGQRPTILPREHTAHSKHPLPTLSLLHIFQIFSFLCGRNRKIINIFYISFFILRL